MFFNLSDQLEKISNTVKQIGVHDHTCSIYDTRDEQFAAVIPFIKQGLENNEKCIYVTDENTAEEVIECLSSGIPCLDEYINRGALFMIDSKTAYLSPGCFSPDFVTESLREQVKLAKEAGYKAFRIAAEMTWALENSPGVEDLMDYESQVNHLYEELDAAAICQYSRKRFSPEMIKQIILTHPVVIYKGTACRNYNYVPPEHYLSPNIEYAEVNRTLEQMLFIEKREKSLLEKNEELLNINEKLNEEVAIRKHTEELHMNTLKELERSNQELEQFAYIASHDLQEPIRMISVYTKLLEKDLKDKLNERTQQCMYFITDGAKRMHALIQDLLAFSRLASRGETMTETDLNCTMAEIMRDLQVSIIDHKAEVEFDRMPVVKADPTQMRQLFQNLIQNSIKFKGDTNPLIHVTSERTDGEWLFCVRDNGIGISPEYSDRVFEIFQRLHEKERYPGTGIGLAICKKIVERHGGRIWIESEEGKGSAFYFTIKAD